MTTPLQVLLISGSIRLPSYTRSLAESIEGELIKRGVETELWDLRKSPLPIANPAFHGDPSQHTDKRVRRLVTFAASCDAMILASPIYHNSYSGVLKNALDHLTIEHFYHKPVGLVSHGGNRSTQAVDHLRIVVRGLLGTAIPSQICTDSQDYRESGTNSYELISENILLRLDRFATELLLFAQMLRLIRQRGS